MNSIVEDSSINLKQTFVDEYDDPLLPSESTSGPTVTIFDRNGEDVIMRAIAAPTTNPGEWEISASVPYMDLVDEIDLKVVWLLFDEELNSHRVEEKLTVIPQNQNRISDIVVLKRPNDTKISFVLPITLRTGNPDYDDDTLILDIALNNVTVVEGLDLINDPSVTLKKTKTQVSVSIPATFDTNTMRLEPISLIVTHTDGRRAIPKLLTHNLWVITPQVAIATDMVSQFIDKAKLENVIPALEYTTGDIVHYLYRGLQTFNSFPPHVSSFTGMNMQGVLLDCWVICSCKAALSSQLLAEGAHAFDFAGQTVNLNVDRTASIEAAIGRLDSEIENQVKPYKKLLAKAGVNGGDGSVGSKAPTVGLNFGAVGIINSPTSKLGRGPGAWLRSPLRTSGRG